MFINRHDSGYWSLGNSIVNKKAERNGRNEYRPFDLMNFLQQKTQETYNNQTLFTEI